MKHNNTPTLTAQPRAKSAKINGGRSGFAAAIDVAFSSPAVNPCFEHGSIAEPRI